MLIKRYLFMLETYLTFRNLLVFGGKTDLYIPYNITFNSTGFEWQGIGNIINIPEYERISFIFTSSSLEPVTQIKYGIRILSPNDDTLLQRPVYINKNDNVSKQVTLNLTSPRIFNIVIRGLVKIPNRFTNDNSVAVWAIKDTEIVYTGSIDNIR